MSVVLDASLTLSAALLDEKDDGAAALFERCIEAGAVVPPLWFYEVLSGIRNAVRRKRATEAEGRALLGDMAQIHVTVVNPDSAHLSRVFSLSMRFGISTYDAAYIDLALEQKAPLATRDQQLADVARTLGIPIFRSVSGHIEP